MVRTHEEMQQSAKFVLAFEEMSKDTLSFIKFLLEHPQDRIVGIKMILAYSELEPELQPEAIKLFGQLVSDAEDDEKWAARNLLVSIFDVP